MRICRFSAFLDIFRRFQEHIHNSNLYIYIYINVYVYSCHESQAALGKKSVNWSKLSRKPRLQSEWPIISWANHHSCSVLPGSFGRARRFRPKSPCFWLFLCTKPEAAEASGSFVLLQQLSIVKIIQVLKQPVEMWLVLFFSIFFLKFKVLLRYC